MAGFYPDPPNNRVAYDADGSVGVRIDNAYNITATMTAIQLQDMNTELSTSGLAIGTNQPVQGMALGLSNTYDITHYLIWNTGNGPAGGAVQASADSTNGSDGTWSNIGTTPAGQSTSKAFIRQNIQAVTANGIKWIRFLASSTNSFENHRFKLHIYGHPSAAPDSVEFWHPTLDQRIDAAYFDFGDVRQSTSNTLTYRVKNSSSTQTAQSIVIGTEALTDATPTLTTQFQHSTDGTNFSNTINIGDLSPGAISSELSVRRTMAANAALGLWWGRFTATPGSWV
jgi:hypothetical protein